MSGRVLRQFRVVASASRGSGATQGLPCRKLQALRAIAEAPGIRVNDLAEVLGIRQPSASQVVKSLSVLHLVEVRRHEGDRRAVQILVTEAGHETLRRCASCIDFGDRLPQALASLAPASLDSLESGLHRLLQALRGSAAQPPQARGPSRASARR